MKRRGMKEGRGMKKALMRIAGMIALGAVAFAVQGRDVSIMYRGRVVGDDDKVVRFTNMTAVIGFYAERLSGEPLFAVTNNIKPGANGVFQTAVTSPDFAGLIQSNQLNYVGLTVWTNNVMVGDGEIQPRQPVLPHPLAGVAAVADSLAPNGSVTRFESTLIYADTIVCPVTASNGATRVEIAESLTGAGGTIDVLDKWTAGESVDIRAESATGTFNGEWTSLGMTWSKNWNVQLIKGEFPTNETAVLRGAGAYFFSSLGELSAANAPMSYEQLRELRNRSWKMPGLMIVSQTNELPNAFTIFKDCCRDRARTGEKYVMPKVKAHYLPFNTSGKGGAK